MKKTGKRSRESLKDDQSHVQRSTRSRTQRLSEQPSPRERNFQVKKVREKVPNTASDEALNLLTYSSVDKTSTAYAHSQRMNRSLEENLLAFLDGSANADPEEILEDKMTFLEATHSLCVAPSLAHIPTPKMGQAILQFIQESHSVGLTISSFELLTDLEKRHPRVATADVTDPDPDQRTVELIVDMKVWSPLEESCKELATSDKQPTNVTTEVPSNIVALMEAIARRLRGRKRPSSKTADQDASECGRNYVVAMSQFMMCQHLVSLIRTDLRCRLEVFDSSEQEKDFTVVQESYMFKLLCGLSQAEKKAFLVNLDYMMDPDNLEEEEVMDDDLSGKISDWRAKPPEQHQERETTALQGTPRDFGHLASDFLVLIMKLDALNQEFRVVSTSLSRRRNRMLFDTLLGIYTKASTLDAYLKAVPDPSSKVRFVMDYFVNFAPKPVAQELVDCSVLESMDKLLACFLDLKTLKAVVKVFKDADTLPLLLSHAFQAFLLLHEDQNDEQIRKSRQESRTRVCSSMDTAFTNLRTVEREAEMHPIGVQTLFVANRILVRS